MPINFNVHMLDKTSFHYMFDLLPNIFGRDYPALYCQNMLYCYSYSDKIQILKKEDPNFVVALQMLQYYYQLNLEFLLYCESQ